MTRIVFKLVLLILINVNFLEADNIDTLLDIYAKESDLSKKTKKEASGNVIVYTRQDLETMQIKSLSELLKSIPFYRYNESKLGYTNLLLNNGFPVISSGIRVYINERELTSPFYGHGLGIISKFDIAYIDHVEIYTGVTSFEFGVEPANMIVRLYTKNPNREVGGQLTTNYSSYNSSEHSISYANILDNFSYYAYANKKESNEKKIKHSDTTLSRDKESKHLFLSIQNDTNRIEYNRIEAKSDFFMDGIGGGDGSPNLSNTDVDYNLLGWYSTYFDKKLSLSIDYIQADTKSTHIDDEPLKLIDLNSINPLIPKGTTYSPLYYSLYNETTEKQLSVVSKYKFNISNHNILTGLQFRKKDFVSNKLLADGISQDSPILYTKEKVYGAFFEDTYSLNEKQVIVSSIKHDIVKPNGNHNKEKLSLYRLGYIFSENGFNLKTYLVSTESRFDPNLYIRGNTDSLKAQRDDSIKVELNWKKKTIQHKINLFKIKQINKLSSEGEYHNLEKPYNHIGLSYTNIFNFNPLNKIDTNFFIKKEENKVTNEKETLYGGNIRLINHIGKFDLYNELIYRDGYNHLEAGYDFNFAITYNKTRDLKVFIKGENVFNKAIKTIYTDKDTVAPYDTNSLGPISVTNQKFWLGMEYRF